MYLVQVGYARLDLLAEHGVVLGVGLEVYEREVEHHLDELEAFDVVGLAVTAQVEENVCNFGEVALGKGADLVEEVVERDVLLVAGGEAVENLLGPEAAAAEEDEEVVFGYKLGCVLSAGEVLEEQAQEVLLEGGQIRHRRRHYRALPVDRALALRLRHRAQVIAHSKYNSSQNKTRFD